MKIRFLIHNVYGVGGTVRTVINLAHSLAALQHDVEIASIYRRRPTPIFDINPNVSLRPLLDMRRGRPDRANLLIDQPSSIVPESEEFAHFYNALTDERVGQYLASKDVDVWIGTRPALNLYIAQLAANSSLRIAQEHMTHSLIPAGVTTAMQQSYGGLDACVTVTEADAQLLSDTMSDVDNRPHILAIPNSVPQPPIQQSNLDSKLVIAAGRVEDIKRYELLIQAFALVVDNRPDWSLRIYGHGAAVEPLRGLIDELQLNAHVTLMGQFSPIYTEWTKGSIAAVTSEWESFGMTIVEAMSCGLPVVSTDCPVGPREIISDADDGFLVPVGEVSSIADRLLCLINDDELRKRMGTAARSRAHDYDPAAIAGRYTQLFASLNVDRANQSAAALTTPQLRAKVAEPKSTPALPQIPVQPRKPTVITAATTVLDAPPGLIRQLPARTWRAAQVSRTRHGRRQIVRRARKLARTRVDDFWNYLDRAWSHVSPLVTFDDKGHIKFTFDIPANVSAKFSVDYRLRGSQQSISLELDEEPTTDSTIRRLSTQFPSDSRTCVNGMWDIYLRAGHGRRHRVSGGARDLRYLLSPQARPETTPFTWHIPYETRKGGLSIRSFARQRHAELDGIQITDGHMHIKGCLIGETFDSASPILTLRHRQSPGRELCLNGDSRSGGGFSAAIKLDNLVSHRLTRHDDFDIWVSQGPTGEPVRVAKILTDIPWKKDLFRFPNISVEEEYDEQLIQQYPPPNLRIRPYFTPAEELSILVSDK